MSETIQTAQLILFAIPVVALAGVGLAILLKPVVVLRRRWMLLVLLPLLLANTLAVWESGDDVAANGWFWLVAAVDLGLSVAMALALRGYEVYGLDQAELEAGLCDGLEALGLFSWQAEVMEKRLFWETVPDAMRVTSQMAAGPAVFWVIPHSGNFQLLGETWVDRLLLEPVGEALGKASAAYVFKRHAIGVLYLVLALVFAVFSWIFFFEPRLILID